MKSSIKSPTLLVVTLSNFLFKSGVVICNTSDLSTVKNPISFEAKSSYETLGDPYEKPLNKVGKPLSCLLYTSDAADE